MPNPIDLTTAGVHLGYAVETTAGTRPTSGYTDLPGVKSTPSLNPSPEALDATTLNETTYMVYVQGLKDLGGSLEFNFNLTQVFLNAWETLCSAAATAKAAGKATWFCITIPGLTKAVFFKGEPSDAGLPAMEVNSVLETTAYITPTGEPSWENKPTNPVTE